MQLTTLSLILLAIAFAAFHAGKDRALRSGEAARGFVHSRSRYHGYYVLIRSFGPALLLMLLWVSLEPVVIATALADAMPEDWKQLSAGELGFRLEAVRRLAEAGDSAATTDAALRAMVESRLSIQAASRWLLAASAMAIALLSGGLALKRVGPEFRARTRVETTLTWVLVAASGVALLTTVGIVLSVLFEAVRFFREVPMSEFLFGLEWSPRTAIRADQVAASGRFGAVPLFAGTLLITVIAMLVAVPLGLLTAIYFSEYASTTVCRFARPLIEVLAGIPTVVYGFFAAVTVAPLVRSTGSALGFDVAAGSALAAGLVIGVMLIPLISSLSDDAIKAVPTATREAALALGATRSEALLGVVMPAALPGISGGILLAASRAIGETMIVVMAAGLAANLTANPFEAVTTVTVQIVTLLVGDQEFSSARTLAAFALGLLLFVVTLALNVLGLSIVRRYQARYA